MPAFVRDLAAARFDLRAAVLLAALTVSACIGAGVCNRPLVADNQLYFFMAERAASGIAPHVSLVDTKSQLATLITAAGIGTGRALGLDDVTAARATSVAAAAAAVVGTGMLAAGLSGMRAAAILAAIALLSMRGFVDHAAIGCNPKIFLAAFIAWAHWLSLGRRDAAAGACAGAAFLCWQPALLVVAAVAVESARRGGLRRAATTLAAALVPVLPYEAYFLFHQALGEQLLQTYVMTAGSVHAGADWLASALFVMTEGRPRQALRLVPTAFAAWSAGKLLQAASGLRSAAVSTPAAPGSTSFVIGAAVSLAFTIYDHQGVPDMFFPAPYLAAGAGIALAWCMGLADRAGRAARIAAVTAAAAALAIQLHGGGVHLPAERTIDDQRALAAQVASLAGEYGSVWVYQGVHLLGLAHLDNHVAYGQLYDDVASRLDIQSYRPLREGRMPDVLILPLRPVPGLSRYRGRYEVIESPAFEREKLRVLVAARR
ncbi:MAG TPA: hypothetical protein VEL28_01060 [Candidatus Binatia bacterium]|nr:hypothetical protein [Candidatus Binatia bacterium]